MNHSGLFLQLLSSAVLFNLLQGVFLHHWPLCSGVCDEQELIPARQDPRRLHPIMPIRVNEQTIQLSVCGKEKDVNTQTDTFITMYPNACRDANELVLFPAVCQVTVQNLTLFFFFVILSLFPAWNMKHLNVRL